MNAVRAAGREWASKAGSITNPGIQLNEWERNGWTYHAKGEFIVSTHPMLLTRSTLLVPVTVFKVYG